MGAWHNADGTLDPVKVRAEYPIFKTQPGGRPLHYLDSAATGQRPQRVVDAVSKFLFTAIKVFAGFAAIAAISPVSILAITAIYGLEVLVAGIQAYVFTILTCVYLKDALHPAH